MLSHKLSEPNTLIGLKYIIIGFPHKFTQTMNMTLNCIISTTYLYNLDLCNKKKPEQTHQLFISLPL